MESCPDMSVHMSFSSPAQTLLHMQLVGKNIQNTISCNYFCCCVYQNTIIFSGTVLRKKVQTFVQQFFHLTLVNLNAHLIFILAIAIHTNDSSGYNFSPCLLLIDDRIARI